MAGVVERVSRIRRRDGAVEVLKRGVGKLYGKTVWPLLPAVDAGEVVSGVEVSASCSKRRKLFDDIVPWYTPSFNPDAQKAMTLAHRRHTKPGESVAIAGGGRGITMVVAAQQVGPDGSVTVYEGGKQMVECINDTIRRNEVPATCEVNHAIVASELDVAGDTDGATLVAPADLPPVDVLEVDVEGAEFDLLTQMSIRPRLLIVEVHPHFLEDEEVETIHDLLTDDYRIIESMTHTGYRIESGPKTLPNDSYIVVAVREQ